MREKGDTDMRLQISTNLSSAGDVVGASVMLVVGDSVVVVVVNYN